MTARVYLLTGLAALFMQLVLSAQSTDSTFRLVGIVYDEMYRPLPATHVINLDTHEGDVTDSLGIFSLAARFTDTLMVLNIAFRDTLLSAEKLSGFPQIVLRRRYYPLEEAKIFLWGSTYGDFREAIIEMPNQETLGETMGLPRQDPGYIPYDMDPKVVKSPAFLLTSPISFFYQNFNKEAKSARKVYWLNRNKEKIELYSKIISGENLSSITGLSGRELLEFMAFLNEKMACDYNCTEYEIYAEVHALWDAYREATGLD
jgi:hypothetical protein